MPSYTKTFAPSIVIAPVPGAPPVQAPAAFVKAVEVPLRVLLTNRSANGQIVLIAYDASALLQSPATDAYELAPGDNAVFVVNVGEGLFTAAPGAARVSCAISEAFPVAP